MNKIAVENALDYPNATKFLTVLGWILLVLSGYSNHHIGLAIVVIFIVTMPLTLTIATRSEKMSYAKEFKRSWADWVMENTNNFLLVGGITAFVYGFTTENLLFALWLGVMYITATALAMWSAWKIVKKFDFSQKENTKPQDVLDGQEQ